MTIKPYERLDGANLDRISRMLGADPLTASLSGKTLAISLDPDDFIKSAEQAVEEIDHTLIRFTDSVAYYTGDKFGLDYTLSTCGLSKYADRIESGEPLQIRVNPVHVRDTRPLGLYFDGEFVCDVGSLYQEHTFAIDFKTIPLMHKDLYTEQVQKSLLTTYGKQLLRESAIGKRIAIHVDLDVKGKHEDVVAMQYARHVERGYLPINYNEETGIMSLVRLDHPSAIDKYIVFYPKLQSLDFSFVKWMV